MAASLSLGLFGAQAQGAVRAGKNFRLSPDPQSPDPGFLRGEDAVGLAVDPNNPQHIVEVNADWVSQNCEFATSTDGGVTWKGGAFTSPPGFRPTCRVPGHLADSMYAGVAFGSGQDVYATFVTPRGTPAAEQAASTLVAKSTNGGQTFATPIVAMEGGSSSSVGPNYELPELAVDPGAAPGGADRVYVTAHETTSAGGAAGDSAVAVSNNGGDTFSAPVNADPGTEDATDTSEPVIDGNGNVYVSWRQVGKNPSNPAQSVPEGVVRVAKSTNQGQSWQAPVSAATVTGGGLTTTRPPQPAPFTGSTFPRLAVDKRPGNGNLYLVYGQGVPPPTGLSAADHFIQPDSDVYFQRSTNGGANWSAPKLINDAAPKPGTPFTQTRHPSVSVAPNGRVDIVWQDRRHWYRGCPHTHSICDEARLGDTYYVFSTDGGSTFSPNRRITDRSMDNDVGFDYRFGVHWAFGPMSVPIGNDQLLVGWMDSREGNFDSDNQDIYLSKVNLNAPASVPQEALKAPDATALSTQLSDFTYPGGGEGLLAATFASRKGTKVVIANDKDVPGALAGGVLARGNLSEVLLSPASGLPDSVKAEVSRLRPAGAYVIGNAGFLSDQIEADLVAAGVPANTISRLPGGDNAGNAALIAKALDRRSAATGDTGAPAFDAAVIANPASPDASAAAGLAAARRLPFLYVDANSIPAATAEALTSLGINQTLVVGGPQSVSDAVMGQLPPSSKRLGGADQYATSQAVVAESRERGVPDNIAYVADGDSPMDAALAGAAVGRTGGLLLLSKQPLETTAPSTADSMGVSAGLDRIISVQQVAPVVGPGPGGPTAANPIPIVPGGVKPPKDVTAPLVALGGKLAQSIKLGYVMVEVRPDEAAKLSATGTVARPALRSSSRAAAAAKPRKSKIYRLRSTKATAKARQRVRLKLRLTKKAIKAVKRGLKRGRRSTARVTVVAVDSVGNKRKVKRQIRIKD